MTASIASARASAPDFVMLPRTAEVVVRDERRADFAVRERLLNDAFGPARFGKTCQRVRDGRLPARGLALVATDGKRLIGTLRFWNIQAGDRPALLLGPLAVDRAHRSEGIGSAMIRAGLDRARRHGHRAVLLVGDAPYYARFGFERRFTIDLTMPGPVDDARFLGLELMPGALAGARGLVAASGGLVDQAILPMAAAA